MKQLGLRPGEEEDSSLLYICIYDAKTLGKNEARYTVHTLRLSDLLFKDQEQSGDGGSPAGDAGECTNNSKLVLQKVATTVDKDIPYNPGCGVFGSKILFAGGVKHSPSWHASSDIYVFDTCRLSDEEELPIIIEKDSEFGGAAKPEPLLVELDGKLYALAGSPPMFSYSPVFEMFDPNVGRWAPLPAPRFYNPSNDPYYGYAIMGTKIMASADSSSIFSFDVAAPEPEWRLWSRWSFPFVGRVLVLDLDDHGDAAPAADDDDLNSKLMFTCGFNHNGIVAYRMSRTDHGLVDFKRIQGFLKLPPAGTLSYRADCMYSFVHLGGRRICFAISNFRSHYGDAAKGEVVVREKMHLLVMVFEFSFSEIDDSPSFSAKTLGSHVFEFDWSQESEHTGKAELLGCFLQAK